MCSNILIPPSVRAIPPTGQVTARKGGAVTLECKASGNPVPSIYWTKRTGMGKSASKIGEGPVLSLERVERQQAGVYQCTADNSVGDPVTVDMRLDVLSAAAAVLLECWSDLAGRLNTLATDRRRRRDKGPFSQHS
ncbi:hypothetical protein AND_003929 [Anopheles darlingi]|uniref:Ig-like domain-containing protein n=1 Tax=Anopheles darlingi TaxID=43151 RepID=W5JIX9_ANODA|nr:hypothetical protein AND_003929 [Anopheles darlingi]